MSAVEEGQLCGPKKGLLRGGKQSPAMQLLCYLSGPHWGHAVDSLGTFLSIPAPHPLPTPHLPNQNPFENHRTVFRTACLD